MSAYRNQRGFAPLVLIFLIFIILATVFYIRYKYKSGSSQSDHSTPAVITSQTPPSVLPLTDLNKSSKIAAVQNELNTLVKEKSPREALEKMKEFLLDDEIAGYCHGLAHETGRSAYLKYGNLSDALEFSDDICGSGFIHGVIETRLSASENIFHEVETICNPERDGKCLHGVGHGLMYYSNNDLPGSLRACDSFSDDKEKVFCSEGVFMENFSADEMLHPSRYLKVEDPFFACQGQKPHYKGACYFYAPRYFLRANPEKYTEGLKWCQSAEAGFVQTCLTGMGSGMIKLNINKPGYVESLCESGIPEQNRFCIEGMVSYYLVNFYSLKAGRQMCNKLKVENQAVCLEAVEKRKDNFPE